MDVVQADFIHKAVLAQAAMRRRRRKKEDSQLPRSVLCIAQAVHCDWMLCFRVPGIDALTSQGGYCRVGE